MDRTKIEWTDATWNPVRGCSRVSEGCRNCYAESVAARFSGPGQPYHGLVQRTAQGPKWTARIMEVAGALELPLRWTKPRRIFVNSMSDLFHESIGDEFIDKVFAIMALSPRHTFQVLTKRPERMRAYMTAAGLSKRIAQLMDQPTWVPLPMGRAFDRFASSWPLPNVWLGVSVENQAAADERIPFLLDTPAAVRWVSAEPLLGPVRLGSWLQLSPSAAYAADRISRDMPAWTRIGSTRLDWVVVGGESGSNARPMHPMWVRRLRDDCLAENVAFLFKQHGEWLATEFCDDELASLPIRRTAYVRPDGSYYPLEPGVAVGFFDGDEETAWVGKRSAGRVLDGRLWDEYPRRLQGSFDSTPWTMGVPTEFWPVNPRAGEWPESQP